MTLSELAHACNGQLDGPDAEILMVGTDSRVIEPGALFVPIVAERDGHGFIESARRRGAAAALSHRSEDEPFGDFSIVRVGDTTAAFDEIARAARARLNAAVVGITGSVGKTTAKDLTSAVLGAELRTDASLRSFNNELGVPTTLANAPAETQALVVEMGARGPGHIAHLCGLAAPTIGVVTVVATAHLEQFGSIDGVAAAKGELVEALPPDGTAILNADDPRVDVMSARTEASVLRFGETGDVRAEGVRVDDQLRCSFLLCTPAGATPVSLPIPGRHHVTNALAASAAGVALGVSLDHIAAGLGSAVMSPLRMEVTRLPNGARLIDDSYNANPESMSAALRSLAELAPGRRVAVLGTMAELGADGVREHHRMARLADELGIEVVAVGTSEYGAPVVSLAEAANLLADLGDGDAGLLKGSRVAELERVAALLEQG